MNSIDFIDYVSKNNIDNSCVLTHLKETISFSDIGFQMGLCFDKTGFFSIDFEPEYKGVEYAEIDIEFHDITYYSLMVENQEIFMKNPSYYLEVKSLIVSNNSLDMVFLLDSGKEAKLFIEFKCLVLDYDISWMIKIDILKVIHGYTRDKNILLNMLYVQMNDKMLQSISKAGYYGDGDEECFEILQKSQKTLIIPKEANYQFSEILRLYNFKEEENRENTISKSFSLLFLLLGDYQGHIIEDPMEYWLIELCSLSKDFPREYKEELLSFYMGYLFTKHTYNNPYILLLFLIITMMSVLGYPQREIDILFKELYRSDYIKRHEYNFFPKGTLDKFKEMLTVINDSKKEEILFRMLDQMILE